MSKYTIERRKAGWPRYRITSRPLAGSIFVFGHGKFWTERGAQRWIDKRTWAKSTAAREQASA